MMPFDLDGVGSIGGFAIIISIGLLSCLFIFFYQRSVRQLLVNKKKVWELPPRPKHYVQPRRSLVDKIRSMFAQLQDLANSVTVVYLEGPPGFGKTQLACQYAEDFYRRHSHDDAFIGTLNASTKTELFASYLRLAGNLGVTVEFRELPVEERLIGGLQMVSSAVKFELQKRSLWLLIVDNLSSEVQGSNGVSYLPGSGDVDWGCGQILVTTKDGTLVERSFSSWYTLDHGFSDSEGAQLLVQISGIGNKPKTAKKLTETLEGIPLAIAAAGCYIKKERHTYGKNYTFIHYMRDLEKTHRDFAEKQTKHVCNYPWTLTTALVMCVLQQRPLYKVFCFLGSCAHAAMPMRLISRVLGEPLDVVTAAVQETRDSVLLHLSHWDTMQHDHEDPIEVVQTHEVTWNVLREMFIKKPSSDKARDLDCKSQQCPPLGELIDIPVLDWFTLGLKLGISDYDLRVIQEDHPRDNKACKRVMFNLWIRQDFSASFKKLIFALEELCEFKISNQLRKKYGPSPDTMQVYTWSELKILLCFFAKCILNETIGAEDSPLHEFQHRLLPHIQSLLEIKDSHVVFDADMLFRLHYSSGSLFLNIAQRAKAKQEFEESLKAVNKGSENLKQSLEHQMARLSLGVTYSHLGKFNEAKVLFQDLLQSLKTMYGEKSHPMAKALHQIGGCLTPHEEYVESEEYLKSALTMMEEVQGHMHPDVGNVLISLGELLINMDNKTHESIPTLSRAVSIFQPLKTHKRSLASSLIILGHAHCYSNQPYKAADAFQRSLSITQKLFGENSVHSGIALTGLSISHHLLGNIAGSKEYSNRAIAIINTYPEVSHLRAAALRYQHLATVHCIQGDFETASLLLQRASNTITTIQDKRLLLFNMFLSGSNNALQGKLEEAIHALKLPPLMFEKTHSVILSARCLICLEMGRISETIAIRKVLQSRPALKELLSPVLSLLDDPTSFYMIPTVHLLATVVNTYLCKHHISWPAFTSVLAGFNCMQKKLYREADKYFSFAVSQYEASVGPKSLLTIEAQLYHAGCKDFCGAMKVLKCAESRLNSISYKDHYLSAKVSYNMALHYQKSGNRKQAQLYMTETLRKVHCYGGKVHPWAANLMNWLEIQGCKVQDTIPDYRMCARDVYRELIQRETAESEVFTVNAEAAVFIQQWKENLDKQES